MGYSVPRKQGDVLVAAHVWHRGRRTGLCSPSMIAMTWEDAAITIQNPVQRNGGQIASSRTAFNHSSGTAPRTLSREGSQRYSAVKLCPFVVTKRIDMSESAGVVSGSGPGARRMPVSSWQTGDSGKKRRGRRSQEERFRRRSW